MQKVTRTTEPGYLCVLTHPSDPDLYKVGMTTRHPEERLAEHNTRYEKCAGQIVKQTGQKWALKTYVAVQDTYWAESVFWGTNGLTVFPYRSGIEIASLSLSCVESGLKAAQNGGVRPPPHMYDHYYAYRAWMNKRLYGRGITLIGHVRSKYGKSDFRCENGHDWRTTPNVVADGEGCPVCGLGTRTKEEVRLSINIGVVCLLIHPEKPEFIRIGITNKTIEECNPEEFWDGWEIHRYRNVEEPQLAETIAIELFGLPLHDSGEPIKLDLTTAKEKFCDFHNRLLKSIALIEKSKENETASEINDKQLFELIEAFS